MISDAEKFKNDRYVYVKNVFTEQECDEAVDILMNLYDIGRYDIDDACKKSLSFGTIPLWDLQLKKKSMFEEILGLKLIPTYNYCRIYKPGETLGKHIDRPPCEVSVTITLGHIGDIWPIYFMNRSDSAENTFYYMEHKEITKVTLGDKAFSPYMNTSNKLKFMIEKGDGVFYRGCELIHWRDEYVEGRQQAQAFFHYVNANGPFRNLNRYNQFPDYGEAK